MPRSFGEYAERAAEFDDRIAFAGERDVHEAIAPPLLHGTGVSIDVLTCERGCNVVNAVMGGHRNLTCCVAGAGEKRVGKSEENSALHSAVAVALILANNKVSRAFAEINVGDGGAEFGGTQVGFEHGAHVFESSVGGDAWGKDVVCHGPHHSLTECSVRSFCGNKTG